MQNLNNYNKKQTSRILFTIDLRVGKSTINFPVFQQDDNKSLVQRVCDNNVVRQLYEKQLQKKIIESLLSMLKHQKMTSQLKSKVNKFIASGNNKSRLNSEIQQSCLENSQTMSFNQPLTSQFSQVHNQQKILDSNQNTCKDQSPIINTVDVPKASSPTKNTVSAPKYTSPIKSTVNVPKALSPERVIMNVESKCKEIGVIAKNVKKQSTSAESKNKPEDTSSKKSIIQVIQQKPKSSPLKDKSHKANIENLDKSQLSKGERVQPQQKIQLVDRQKPFQYALLEESPYDRIRRMSEFNMVRNQKHRSTTGIRKYKYMMQ